jgi:hypothetical protein
MIYLRSWTVTVTAAVSYLWRPSVRERSRMNVVAEDNQSRPQGRVVVLVEEDHQTCTCSASEGLHMYGV